MVKLNDSAIIWSDSLPLNHKKMYKMFEKKIKERIINGR
jgi:hypothetical protein